MGSRKTKFVHSFIEDAAEQYPEKQALFAEGKWHTYRELDETANRLAHLLAGQGLDRGDRVALLLKNSMEYVVSYYATLKAGGIAVPLNTGNTAADVDFIVRDCGARFLVTTKNLLARIAPRSEWMSGSPPARLWVWSETQTAEMAAGLPAPTLLPAAIEAESAANPGRRLIDLDTASIVYTSGSTGQPRGVVLSHLNIATNTRSIVDYLELTAADRIMVVLPFFYIYGKSLLNTHFCVGGSVVVDNRFLYPNTVLQTMQEQQVTGFAGVPSTYSILLSRSNVKSWKFDSLRYLTQAGGAMAPAVQKEVAATFAPARLFIMYGATEAAARLSYLDPAELPRKWGSIGKAIPNVELFVADERGNRLGAGQEGEIVARGANLMSGYWNRPEETARVLRNGLYFTGDIGKMDDEGYLYVVGRCTDMIKIGGNRVSAKEIEEALQEHPAVIETAVIGVPDEVLGEAPKAFIVIDPHYRGKIETELQAFLQKHLTVYKIPRLYELRDALPKNEAGKIQKLKLARD
jgi:long-chain acyl-CoA synthetase